MIATALLALTLAGQSVPVQGAPPPLPVTPPGAAVPPPEEIPAVVVGVSGETQPVDCHGADLQVTGSRDTLTVRRCFTITLLGDANHVRVQLLENSSISAPGNRNVVTFVPWPGASPRVSASGLGNRINPEFSARDSQPRPVVIPGRG